MSTNFLVDVVHKVVLGATTLVCNCLCRAGGEIFDRGEALNSEFFGEGFGVLGFAVDLGDDDVFVTGKVIGKVFPCRSETLAV